MKKTICLMLALVMVLSVLPVSMLTAQEVAAATPKVTASDHTHDDTWTALDADAAAALNKDTVADNAYYYLTEDAIVNFSADGFENKTFTICLNGHNLKGNGDARLFRIQSGVNMTICDCQKKGTISNPMEDGKGYNGAHGNLIGLVNGASTVTLCDVKLDGLGMSAGTNNAGAIWVGGTGSTLSMTNCTITGFAAPKGAAIEVTQNANVEITGGSITANNHTGTNCGTLYMTAGTVTLDGVAVSQNNATYSGEIKGNVIYAGGTAALTIKNSSFTDNKATRASGNTSKNCYGGVLYYCDNADVEITDTTFTGSGAGCGGAIGGSDGTQELTLTRCTFTGNSAYTGGAVYLSSSVTTLTAAVPVKISDCKFDSNRATYDRGGAIFASASTADTTKGVAVAVEDTDFIGNYAKGSTTSNYVGGGAIYVNQNGTLELTDCNFDANTSDGGGGAIMARTTGKVTITRGSFTNNFAKGWGGALFRDYGPTDITNVTMTGNKNQAAATTKVDVRGGSAIYMENKSTVTLDDCTITGNTNTGSSNIGAIQIQEKSTTLIVAGNTFIDGNFTKAGDERNIYYQQSTYSSASGNKNILNVKGLESGARMSLYTTTERASADVLVKLADGATQETWDTSWICYDTNNKQFDYVDGAFVFAEDTAAGHSHEDAAAGTTWTAVDEAADFDLTKDGHYYLTKNLTLTSNLSFGGAQDDSRAGKTIVICLNGHNIYGKGGRVFRLSSGCKLTVCDCTAHTRPDGTYVAGKLSSNVTETDGGIVAIYHTDYAMSGTSFTMTDGIMDGAGVTSIKNGAAIYVADGSSTIKGAVNLLGGEVRNFTSTTGSVINCGKYFDLNAQNVRFYNNAGATSGNLGGVINFKGNGATTPNKLVVKNCVFKNNSGSMGMIRLSTAKATAEITNTDFIGNTASSGGAIHIPTASDVTIDGCNFTNNKATSSSGGAIVVTSTGKNYVIKNSTFTGNSAKTTGGAINVYGNDTAGAEIEISNCEFTENTTDGGATIHLTNKLHDVTLKDCTIKDNVSTAGAVTMNGTTHTLTISGNTVIKDNKLKDGTVRNVALPTGETFVAKTLGDDAVVGITAADFTDASTEGVKVATVDGSVKDGMLVLDNTYNGFGHIVIAGTAANAVSKALAEAAGVKYLDVSEALADAVEADEVIKLLANVTAEVEIPASTIVKLDLNGKNMAGLTGTGAVILMDTQTDDYDVADGKYGKIAEVDNGVTLNSYVRVNGKRYIVLTDENGTHAHRIYAAVTAKALRTKDEGIGYTAKFGADQVLQAAITGYGMELSANGNAAQTLDVKAINAQRAFENGKDLVFAITKFFETGEVNTNAGYAIAGTPFVQVGTQKFTAEADQQTVTFKQMFNYANDNFNTAAVKDAAKAGLKAMYDKYKNDMIAENGWNINNVSQYVAQ